MAKLIIVNISNKLRDSLIETLDKNDTCKKKRTYYLVITINRTYAVLIPIRENCNVDYYIPLKTKM